jgi:chromosome segregation ATPase
MSIITKVNADHIRNKFTPDVARGALDLLARAQTAQTRYMNRAREIDASTLLTPQGKALEKDKAWKEFEAELAKLRKEANGYEANIVQMREKQLKAIDKEMTVAQALVRELRAREIRDLVRGDVNEDLRAMQMYEEAIENGDEEMADALENSPIPILSADVLRRGIQRRMEKADPELAQKIDELEQAHASVTTTLNELMREAAAATSYQPAVPITVNGKQMPVEEMH